MQTSFLDYTLPSTPSFGMHARIAERSAKHQDQKGFLGITVPELDALVGYIDQQADSKGLLQGWPGKDNKPLLHFPG